MFYSIRHVTRFRYSAPVRESVMEIRMQPRSEGPQTLRTFQISTNPRTATAGTMGVANCYEPQAGEAHVPFIKDSVRKNSVVRRLPHLSVVSSQETTGVMLVQG